MKRSKSKVDKLDFDKLVLGPADLSKPSDVVKNDVVKKDLHNAKIKDIEDKIRVITDLPTNTTFNFKINEVKNKIPSITNFATTTAFTAVENKRSDHRPYHYSKFNKLIAENFTLILKKANLATKGDVVDFLNKTDFDDKTKKFK